VSLRFAYSYPQKDLSSIKKSKMIQLWSLFLYDLALSNVQNVLSYKF
jgi:hypothetical protein